MFGKLSIIGVVGAILLMPTTLLAQVGGSINPGVGAAFNRGAAIAGAVGRGIPSGLGRHPSSYHHHHHPTHYQHRTTAKPRR
jgi:hypothetical protein